MLQDFHHSRHKWRKMIRRKRRNIPPDVFRKKSSREYNCSITTNNRNMLTSAIQEYKAGSPRFGHLQRKKKTHILIFVKLTQERTESSNDKKEPLFGNHEMKNIKQSQNSDVNCPTDLSTLWEDLFSSRHFRLKPVEVQCYFVPQTVRHPIEVRGIQWANLRYEILRLATFSNYPTNATKAVVILAQDGFVYTGNGSDDTVMCFSCCVTKNNWLVSEDVSEVHKMLTTDCSMVTGRDNNNIPVQAESLIFDKLLESLSRLNMDEGYGSIENEKERNNHNIEADAAPLTTQEQTYRNVERANITANELRLPKNTNANVVTSSSPNKTSVHHSPVLSSNDRFATVEQAYIVMPPSATTALEPTNLSNENSIAQAAEIQNEIVNEKSKPSGNSQPQSSNNTSSTPNNITTNSGNSHNHVAENQPKNPEPPKNHAGKSKDGKGPTYSELGIVTERPKRTEYALKRERLKTFVNWPPSHHIKQEDLADAGFYYAGYGDCARCFFCGGGLRNWEDEDDVWVEHARWFPKCAFIRQLMGQNFVDSIQELNKTKDKITFTMVTDAMGCSASAYLIGIKANPLLRDPAVKALIECKYDEKTVLDIARDFKSKDVPLSADVLLTKYKETSKGSQNACSSQLLDSSTSANTEEEELIRQVKEKNSIMRQQTMCKICMDKDVEVVFLPCGHLVSCAECAGALNDCPVCRKTVKGTVRAFIS